MSETFYDLTESYQNLRREIETVEQKFQELPAMRKRLHELAEDIKAYVSDPGLEPAEEPMPIEPMADLSQGDPDLLRNEPDLDATVWTYGDSGSATTE